MKAFARKVPGHKNFGRKNFDHKKGGAFLNRVALFYYSSSSLLTGLVPDFPGDENELGFWIR